MGTLNKEQADRACLAMAVFVPKTVAVKLVVA